MVNKEALHLRNKKNKGFVTNYKWGKNRNPFNNRNVIRGSLKI